MDQPIRVDVAIDDGPSFPAWIYPSERWNGWLCPHFDRGSATRVVEWVNKAADNARAPEEQYRARWDGDDVIITDGANAIEERVSPDTNGRYSIGAYAWCWFQSNDFGEFDPEQVAKDVQDDIRVIDKWLNDQEFEDAVHRLRDSAEALIDWLARTGHVPYGWRVGGEYWKNAN